MRKKELKTFLLYKKKTNSTFFDPAGNSFEGRTGSGELSEVLIKKNTGKRICVMVLHSWYRP